MKVSVKNKLSGGVRIPPSKSIAHRMLICAACGGNICEIICPQINKDIEATMNCLNNLGARILYDGEKFTVNPIITPPKTAILDCGESGATLRFILPIAAALGVKATFIGHGRLPERPLSVLCDVLKENGITISNEGKLPFTISGKLINGIFKIDGSISSQFVSGLLMALSLLKERCEIMILNKIESKPYINITIDVLKQFGIEVEEDKNIFRIINNKGFFNPCKASVPGDFSSAAYWVVASVVGKNPITCYGVDYKNSDQGDKRVIDILQEMGALVIIDDDFITGFPSKLHGIEIDCQDIPDLVPILSVAASMADGKTIFKNIERLKMKESDRITATLNLLNSCGIDAYTNGNDLIVNPKNQNPHDFVYNSLNDHRMAMAATILAYAKNIIIDITNTDCVSKSYPDFFKHFKKLGGSTLITF